MSTLDLARALVGSLPSGLEDMFNPWVDTCQNDLPINTPASKLERLAAHLDCKPKLILCGEAPGWRGARYSGIAFTSEKLLLQGVIPRVESPRTRLTTRPTPLSEPSATIVWKSLYRLGIAESTVLWNAVQLQPMGANGPTSNRTPKRHEVQYGAKGLEMLREAFPTARIVAVGKQAQAAMGAVGIEPVACIRHPSFGGSTEFNAGLERALVD